MTIMGKKVVVKVWLHLITGDMSGLNDVCAAFNSHDKYRACKCPHEDMDDPAPDCELNTVRDIEEASETPGGLKAISMKEVDNAFWYIIFRKRNC